MDKLTVFVIVLLLAVVRGLLQRRQVASDLEQRLAAARNRTRVRRLSGRLPSQDNDEQDPDDREPDLSDEVRS